MKIVSSQNMLRLMALLTLGISASAYAAVWGPYSGWKPAGEGATCHYDTIGFNATGHAVVDAQDSKKMSVGIEVNSVGQTCHALVEGEAYPSYTKKKVYKCSPGGYASKTVTTQSPSTITYTRCRAGVTSCDAGSTAC